MSKGGGKQTTEVKLPKELTEAAKQNIELTNAVSQQGYTPYRGATVAGLSPQQLAGMQGSDQAASAFGMPSAVNWQAKPNNSGFQLPEGMDENQAFKALTGMEQPGVDTGMGFSGYSAAGMYDEALASMPPATRALIESFFMNGETGAAPTNKAVPNAQGMQQNPDGTFSVAGPTQANPSVFEQYQSTISRARDLRKQRDARRMRATTTAAAGRASNTSRTNATSQDGSLY